MQITDNRVIQLNNNEQKREQLNISCLQLSGYNGDHTGQIKIAGFL